MILYLPLVALLVYAPSLEGPPLWDDNYFIFWRYFFDGAKPLSHIWSASLWPLFDTVVKALYALWGEHAWAWRLLNLTLHTLNAYALGRLVSSWRPQWKWPLRLLFLVHPLNVMSVAFIIQLKTLMAASFLLLSWGLWQRWERKGQSSILILAVLSFAASLASKSSALPFPAIALLALVRRGQLSRQRALALVPFFLCSTLSLYRISRDAHIERITTQTEKVLTKALSAPVAAVPVPAPTPARTSPSPAPEPKVESIEVGVTPPPPMPEAAGAAAPEPTPEPMLPPPAPSPPSKAMLVAHNLGDYLSFPWWPWPLSLSHGVFQGPWSARAALGAGGLVVLSLWGLFRRRFDTLLFVWAQVLALVPFLGLVVAPYMSYTSISEQHLYFVLPFALMLQLQLLERVPTALCYRVLAGLVVVLSVVSFEYNYAYRSEEALFQRVLRERPQDLFAQLNLAGTWARSGQTRRARLYLEKRIEEAQADPVLQHSPILPLLNQARRSYQAAP